jgi:hypothetical protein
VLPVPKAQASFPGPKTGRGRPLEAAQSGRHGRPVPSFPWTVQRGAQGQIVVVEGLQDDIGLETDAARGRGGREGVGAFTVAAAGAVPVAVVPGVPADRSGTGPVHQRAGEGTLYQVTTPLLANGSDFNRSLLQSRQQSR